MKQPARIDTRTSLEKLSGLLDAGRQQFGGLLGAIPVVGQMEAIDRGIRAAGQGNMTGVAEAAADIIPAGRLATRGIKALTKGKSTGLLGDVMNIEKPKYQGAHSAPDKDYGAPLNDISRDMYPADVYSAKGLQYYGSNSPGERESLDIARKVRGNPDAMVTVYRAVPKGLQADINAGDWITPSKEYAKYHAENVIKGQQGQDYEILSKKVPAKHVYTDANSLAEYGYDPTGLGIQGGTGQGTDSTQLNRFETDADRRMAVAQRNAVEMLGLPPDNTAMDRAKAMGFDVDIPLYHGTDKNITEFLPDKATEKDAGWYGQGIYTTPDTDAASGYANWNKSLGQNVMPLLARKGKVFDYGDAPPLKDVSESKSFTDAIRNLGYDTIEVPNKYADPRFANNYETVLQNPNQLRSRFAAFDPARRKEADLLALQGSQSAINLPNFERLLGLLEDSQ